MRASLRILIPVPALALAAVLLAALPGTAAAQADGQPDWNRLDDPLAGGVGLHYGKLGGHGLAFRLPLRWWLYAQVAGGIWHGEDRKQHNLGLQVNYLLRQDQRMRLYVAGGLAYFYDKDRDENALLPNVWSRHEDWNSGGGIGVEYLKGQRWSIQVEADFVHTGRNQDIKLIPQFGLYFYW